MSFIFPKAALGDIIAPLVGMPRTNVYFEGEPIPSPGPKGGRMWGTIILNLTSDTSNGEDEIRTDFVAGTPGAMFSTQITTGMYVVSARADAWDQTEEGHNILRQLRSRLQRQSVQQQLDTLGLGLSEAPRIIHPMYIVDHAHISAAILEIKLIFAITDDVTADRGAANGTDGWIETTEIHGEKET